MVFAALELDAFSTVTNPRNVAADAAVLLVLAVGMTFVIITAGIDLSVGSVLVFSGVVSAKADERHGRRRLGVILVGLVVRAGRRARRGACSTAC